MWFTGVALCCGVSCRVRCDVLCCVLVKFSLFSLSQHKVLKRNYIYKTSKARKS